MLIVLCIVCYTCADLDELSVWSRNRKILDDFLQEARTHYYNSPLPPRVLSLLPDAVCFHTSSKNMFDVIETTVGRTSNCTIQSRGYLL